MRALVRYVRPSAKTVRVTPTQVGAAKALVSRSKSRKFTVTDGVRKIAALTEEMTP